LKEETEGVTLGETEGVTKKRQKEPQRRDRKINKEGGGSHKEETEGSTAHGRYRRSHKEETKGVTGRD
jgi:hypothetical protein